MSSSAAPEADAQPPRVLVYRSALLSRSETFVLEQLQALRRWQPVLVGERRVPGLDLPPASMPVVLSRGQARAWRGLRRRWAGHAEVALRADLRRLQPLQAVLVHAHFGTDGVEVAPLARALGLPLLVTLHGFDIHIRPAYWESGAAGWGMRRYPARLRALAQAPRVSFVAVSRDIARQAQAWGIAEDRIAVLPIGIDVERFRPGPLAWAERPVRLLFVGRLVEKKGCRYLIEALADPALRRAAAELVVIGDGPLRPALEQQARALGVPVQFLGACGADQVRRSLDSARALCLPSVTADNGDAEGFGLVLLEAQACGVPVVSSARGGSEDGLVDGVTGFAVPERDVAGLARALAAVLGDAAGAVRMAQAARAFVLDRYDLRRCTAALEAHYDRLVRVAA
jgi:glycosyltransferase involved in cell wall biosynthesis